MLMSTARELWSTSIYINNTWYGSWRN
jgi:hypothetical protein